MGGRSASDASVTAGVLQGRDPLLEASASRNSRQAGISSAASTAPERATGIFRLARGNSIATVSRELTGMEDPHQRQNDRLAPSAES